MSVPELFHKILSMRAGWAEEVSQVGPILRIDGIVNLYQVRGKIHRHVDVDRGFESC
jgi:hypothetical protein